MGLCCTVMCGGWCQQCCYPGGYCYRPGVDSMNRWELNEVAHMCDATEGSVHRLRLRGILITLAARPRKVAEFVECALVKRQYSPAECCLECWHCSRKGGRSSQDNLINLLATCAKFAATEGEAVDLRRACEAVLSHFVRKMQEQHGSEQAKRLLKAIINCMSEDVKSISVAGPGVTLLLSAISQILWASEWINTELARLVRPEASRDANQIMRTWLNNILEKLPFDTCSTIIFRNLPNLGLCSPFLADAVEQNIKDAMAKLLARDYLEEDQVRDILPFLKVVLSEQLKKKQDDRLVVKPDLSKDNKFTSFTIRLLIDGDENALCVFKECYTNLIPEGKQATLVAYDKTVKHLLSILAKSGMMDSANKLLALYDAVNFFKYIWKAYPGRSPPPLLDEQLAQNILSLAEAPTQAAQEATPDQRAVAAAESAKFIIKMSFPSVLKMEPFSLESNNLQTSAEQFAKSLLSQAEAQELLRFVWFLDAGSLPRFQVRVALDGRFGIFAILLGLENDQSAVSVLSKRFSTLWQVNKVPNEVNIAAELAKIWTSNEDVKKNLKDAFLWINLARRLGVAVTEKVAPWSEDWLKPAMTAL